MGGMFSVVKVRKGQKRGDYGDPGWFKHPAGGGLRVHRRTAGPGTLQGGRTGSMPRSRSRLKGVEVKVRKPGGGHGGHN